MQYITKYYRGRIRALYSHDEMSCSFLLIWKLIIHLILNLNVTNSRLNESEVVSSPSVVRGESHITAQCSSVQQIFVEIKIDYSIYNIHTNI